MTLVWKGYRKLQDTFLSSWFTEQDSNEEPKEYTAEVVTRKFDDLNLEAPE
jgi:hypothetical protein